MKGGAFLPLFIAALAPLLVLGLVAYGSSIGAVAWEPPILWTDQFGNPNLSSGVTSVGAVNGSVYVEGYLNYNATPTVPFIREYLSDGTIAWTNPVENFTETVGLTIGPDGIYVIGGSSKNSTLRSYNFDGSRLWSRTLDAGVVPSAISASANGVYVVGSSDHALTNQTFTGSNILFLRRYDSSGGLVWTREFSNSSGANVFLYLNRADISAGASGVYALTGLSLVAYSLNGQQLWSRQFGSPTVNNPSAISQDSTGMYVSGTFGPLSFPTGLLTKYSFSGSVVWNDTFESPNSSGAGPSSISAGSSGIYLSMGSFVARYDSNGRQVWNFQTPLKPQYGFHVAAVQEGYYLAGATGEIHGGIRGWQGLVQSFSSSSSLVFFGVNPPFSFVLVGALIGGVVLSVFILRRRYLRVMSKRRTLASAGRYRMPGGAPAD